MHISMKNSRKKLSLFEFMLRFYFASLKTEKRRKSELTNTSGEFFLSETVET